MAEYRSSREDYLDLDEDPSTPAPASVEQIDNQVAQAQERLLALKRQAELLEREKAKLEELSRRQEQFDTGRAELVDKFTGSLVQIQRETDETLKRLEVLKNIQSTFSTYLQELEAINPKEWEAGDLTKELSRALGAVEDARSVYTKASAQIAVEPLAGPPVSEAESSEGGQSFSYWLMAGLAFTLPLVVIGLLALILLFLSLNPA
jgi:chromosome segregation ATPase